ncbi:hypothetical protein [Cupriavidus sp. D39]|uniref:hypothetical protein n=1 Tax=Cupriavidus sp. D39 TaxID=2997877 RepID=UPI00226E23D0|nr:hypothetical protein [Cupriavidus sp. D39]MCY0853232.1 hypothetical protein [Cupriavidus sp. D39]
MIKIRAQLFTPESFDGFVIERVRDNSLEGRFIEKLSYQEITTDPFGREESFERITYRSFDFTLFSDYPNIELRDCQRSTKEFVNKLLELCNFSLSISPLSINLMDWVDALQDQISRKIIVDSLQLSGLALEEGVNAKILLKGKEDVRKALEDFSRGRNLRLKRCR